MGRGLRVLGLTMIVAACGTADTDEALTTDTDTLAQRTTWHDDVAPLLAERCGSCHRPEGIAPFSLLSYEEGVAWSDAVMDSVEQGRMPPFDARTTETCTPERPYAHDPTLTEAERQLLRDWIAADTPEGEEKPAPEPPALDTIEEPDAVLTLPEPFTVDGQHDIYQCFRIELPLEEDVWMKGVQVIPDNDLVVHHVLVWTDPEDQSADRVDEGGSYPCSGTPDIFPTDLLAIWTPGAGVTRPPEGAGSKVKKGSSIVVNVHYHPTGTGAEVDQSQVALEWTTEQPEKHISWFLADLPFGATLAPGPDDTDPEQPEFRIPAGASSHTETVVLDTGDFLPFPIPIYAITPHMHYLGTEMQVRILRKSDYQEDACLVHTPTYRFDWQTSYVFDAPLDDLPTIQPGDKLEITCTYDNSWSNPNLGDALAAAGLEEPVDVTWGEETADEMCMAMVGLVLPPIDLFDLLDQFL